MSCVPLNEEIDALSAEADARIQAFQEQAGIGSYHKPYVPFDCPYRDHVDDLSVVAVTINPT